MGEDNVAELLSGEQPVEHRELSFGERAVGLTFNPSGDPAVTKVKQTFAAIIDQMNDLRNSSGSAGVKRHASTAITMAEDAQMRAVKALTWKD